ncbi:MAG TPA: V-type ATP synthase subunit E family protein [Salinivirgaceae bacterium]|nr:V-type ATP synthase subunit E family protein [Salinivirgaceae bacterium]
MENKLQELTQRIYEEGVNKANQEAQAILNKAKSEAEHILREAKKQAEELLAKATEDAAYLKKNTESELQMSAKHVISSIKQQLTELITTRAIETVKETLKDDDFIKQILSIVISEWAAKQEYDLLLILPQNKQNELEKYIESKAKNTLNQGIELQFTNQIKGGFKIGPKDGKYVISFTDEDFENLFKAFARPKLKNLLFGNN